MSVFTVVMIIWVIYQLGVALMKKGKQQAPGNSSGPLKLPNVRSMRETLQGTSPGTWREQLKQAMENASHPEVYMKPSESEPKEFEESMDGFVQTEGTQGVEGTQGIEGTSDYVGLLGLEAYKPVEEIPSVPSNLSGVRNISLTERELVQGVIWSVVLGKPRAMQPFRGPRA